MPLFCAEWLPASAFARSASADRPNLGGGWLAGRSPLASAPSRLVRSTAFRIVPLASRFIVSPNSSGFAALTLGLEIRLAAQVSLRLKLLDDLLDQLIELLLGVLGIPPVLTEQPFERFLRQHAAVEDRFHDRVVQRLPRVPGLAIILVRQSVRIIEA